MGAFVSHFIELARIGIVGNVDNVAIDKMRKLGDSLRMAGRCFIIHGKAAVSYNVAFGQH